MTRMWGLDTALLCDQHLRGEHVELHQAVGTLRNHTHGEAIVRGHAAKGQVDTARIEDRHDALAEEMERRGMAHRSPMDYSDEHDLGELDAAANRADLAERCPDCRARIEGDETGE